MHRNLFQRRETAELMVVTMLRYRDAGEFQLHEYVVMPDHIHVLLTPKAGSSAQGAVQLIKGGLSHNLRKAGSQINAIWQPRYHDRRIRNANEYAEIAKYIRENPLRRGLVSVAAEWPYSSAACNAILDEPSEGLKPPPQRRESCDAALKRRSAANTAATADLKVGSTKIRSRDAGLKARSTEELTNVLS